MKTLLFVDDENKVLLGLQRQLRIMHKEWEMHFKESGSAALEFMRDHAVDVVVTDMMMPGMDGCQLLLEVSRRHPQTVRIVLSGQAERESVLRLVGPAHQYLSKPCTADDLRATILRAFELRELLGNTRLKELTTRIKSLPSLLATQSELLEELRRETPSLERVGEIVARDIGMTAKVLQLVNSAFFGIPRQISSPAEAVAYLGLSTLQALAFSMEVFSRFNPQACRLFSLDVLERHSWTTGLLARRIAALEQQGNQMMELAFLAGMMHDVGQLVLAQGLDGEYSEAIRQARQQNRAICEIESVIFGASHAEVGAYLLGLWGLPDLIIQAVAWHHHPRRSPGSGFTPLLAVHVADFLIHEQQVVDTEVPLPELDLAWLEQNGLAGRIEAWRVASHEIMGGGIPANQS
jgi:HD-like signal output (HDOD) protein